MKTYFKVLLISVLFATGCSPSYMGSAVYEDDIYYNPNETPLVVQKVESKKTIAKSNPLAPASTSQAKTKIEPKINTEDVDNRDFSEIQRQYTEILANDSIQSIDTVVYEGDSGYYLGGFTGTDRDQEEAERLREMYPQGFGYYNNTGYEQAMWLAGDSDWNVYVDGFNVWWTPSWTNYRFYNSYNFSPHRYARTFAYPGYYSGYPHWGLSFGFWDPWYWDIHFGWNYHPYGYGGYYGYGHHYYGHGHGHHYYGHNDYYYGAPSYHGKRRSNSYKAGTSASSIATRRNNGNASSAVSMRRSAAGTLKAGASTATRRISSSNADDLRRSRAATRYSTRTRSSYSNQKAVQGSSTRRSVYKTSPTTRYGSQDRKSYSRGSSTQNNRSSYSNTRRSTSPSYNRPTTTKRPSYNRSSSSRSSGYSKSATRSSYSKVRSNSSGSKPIYRSGSSKSSSGYKSGTSTRRSSGTSYKSSGSSRSSSGVRSSGGSSRSSGGKRSSGGSKRR